MTRARMLTACLAAAAFMAGAAPAAAQVQPYRTNDFGGFRDVLPPGANGRSNLVDLAAFLATGARPAHNDDQRDMYARLLAATPGVDAANLGALFKDASFGSPPGGQARAYSPAPGLTITRDAAYGVPHVYGTTRQAAMFGLGYVAAEDRLFFIDVLRHTGRGRLSSFAGGAAANRVQDAEQWANAPYTEADLERQADQLDDLYGADGLRLQQDAASYVAGVNRYISEAKLDITKMPAEYVAIGRPLGPDPGRVTDVIATAALVGGIFGKGGGGEFANARWLQQLQQQFGAATGTATYNDLRERNDAEAPTTATTTFPYGGGPGIHPGLAGVAMPDLDGPTAPGTGADAGSDVAVPAPSAMSLRGQTSGLKLDLPFGELDLSSMGPGLSNALLVSADRTTTGHPLAVFGPQTGYYAPQLLTEIVLDGPGIKARGVSFAATQLVVQLGRGVDYAWSATSASNDNVDTVVERLCTSDGTPVTVRSTSYLVDGDCVPMDRKVHEETALPNPGAPGPPRHLRFEVLRTRHGIVQLRTTVGGEPVAIVSQRSTYHHEVDSVVGFARLNDPDQTSDAASFQRSVSAIDYTFNWFYADSRDISYFSSGLLPLRAADTEFDLPRWGDERYDWQGWLPNDAHVHQTNPPTGHLASWNNKPAPDWSAADNVWAYGPVYRSLALSDRVSAATSGGAKVSRAQLVGIVADAATVDSRARYTLPMLLDVVGDDPMARRAIALLKAWLEDGAHRVDRDRDGSYAHGAAIALFDEWWESQSTSTPGEESAAKDVLARGLGPLTDALPSGLDDHPRVGRGSAWNGVAWYGYLNKDLRQVLGQPVAAPYSRTYCGAGSLAQCRADLRRSLKRAVARVLADQGRASVAALTYDKHQDDIRHVAAGLVGVRPIDWQNRPTFQQVVDFRSHR
jgi:acyl-homoserine lactone acylase PvdQ